MTIRNTLPCAAAMVGPAVAEGTALGRALVAGALGLVESCAARPWEHAAPSRQEVSATATIRAVLNLKGGRWDLAVLPERGGRIASLRLDGAELLDQGIGVNQPTAKNFVEGAEGPGIELSWDRTMAPYCGVWICNGDLGGYRQVAIEPATGGGDRPDSDQPPPTHAGGESLRWWLKIRPL